MAIGSAAPPILFTAIAKMLWPSSTSVHGRGIVTVARPDLVSVDYDGV